MHRFSQPCRLAQGLRTARLATRPRVISAWTSKRPFFLTASQFQKKSTRRLTPSTSKAKAKSPRETLNLTPEDEDFYNYCMTSNHWFSKPFDPTGWTRKISIGRLKRQLPESLHQDPLNILYNNSADITSVKHCLDLYIAQIKTQAKSAAAEQAAHKRDKSGEKALLWLLDSGAVDNVDLRSHEELLACLAYCIAAQGKNDAFLQWLNIPHVPGFAVDWPPIEQRRWKATALRQFIEAIAFFSTRTSGLEDSIDTFLGLVSPLPHPHAPALARAGMWIRDQIVVNDQAKLLKQDLFRRFRESIPFWIRNKGECWFQQSQLDLARGDCDSAIFALSSQATKATLSAYFDESLEISPRHFGRMLFYYLVRLARSLHQQGRYAEAFAAL